MEYLKSFVIGSSAFASVPWMWSQKLERKGDKFNYDYYSWSWQMPIRHGFWNIASLVIAEHFNLTLRNRFLVITFLDWIVTILSVKALQWLGYKDFMDIFKGVKRELTIKIEEKYKNFF